MRIPLRFIFSALLAISLAAFSSTASLAHSGVVSSSPSSDQVVNEIPSEISVTFSEELLVLEGRDVNTLSLAPQGATEISLADVRVEGNLLRASVPAGEYPAGTYVMTYRVISADGHEVSDAITFSLDIPIAAPASSASPEVVKSESQPFALPLPIVLAIALLIVAGGFYLLARRRRSN